MLDRKLHPSEDDQLLCRVIKVIVKAEPGGVFSGSWSELHDLIHEYVRALQSSGQCVGKPIPWMALNKPERLRSAVESMQVGMEREGYQISLGETVTFKGPN